MEIPAVRAFQKSSDPARMLKYFSLHLATCPILQSSTFSATTRGKQGTLGREAWGLATPAPPPSRKTELDNLSVLSNTQVRFHYPESQLFTPRTKFLLS